MSWDILPSTINDVARLFFNVRKDFGAEVFDNPESFDEVFGAGSFAKTQGAVLDMVRGMIESSPDHLWRFHRSDIKEVKKQRSKGE